MASELELLSRVPGIVDLGDDLKLLAALGAAAGKFDEIKGHIDGLASVEDLLEKIAGGLEADEILSAFAAVDAAGAHADLVALLGKITDATHKLPDKYRALFKPISAYNVGDADAVVIWKIATPDTPVLATDAYKLQLGAEGSITLDAGATLPDDVAGAKLLKLGAAGKLEAGATATLPYAFGAVSGGADASVEAALDYYFKADEAALYAVAVAEGVAEFVNPFDFQSVWEAFQRRRLQAMTYRFGGAAHANVEVAFSSTRTLGAGIVADLALAVAVSASLTSAYTLTLRGKPTREHGATILAELSRNRVTEDRFGLELKLGVDLSALTKPVVAAMQRAVGAWDEILADIKPYLNPGTWLRDNFLAALEAEAAVLLDDETLRSALISDLKGALGVTPVDKPALAKWLGGKVTETIDQGSVLVDGGIEAAVDRVMRALAAEVPILARNDANGQLKALVKEQVENVDAELKNAVSKLVDQPGKALKKALEGAGAKVSGAVASLDGALKAVRDLLDHYDDALHAILKEAESVAKEKVTARLYAEEVKARATTVEITGEFTSATPEADAVFRALTRGALQTLVKVVEAPTPTPGFTLDPDSSITRFSSTKATQGLEVALLGFNASFTQWVKGEATLVVDGRRNLRVESDAEAKKILSLVNDREVSFVDAHALALTAATRANPSQGVVALSLGLGAAYSEKTLEWEDIEEFVASLDRARLVTDGVEAQAAAVFARWTPQGQRFRGTVSADLRLGGEAAERLIRKAQRTSTGLSDAARTEIVRTALKGLRDMKAVNLQKFDRAFALARSLFKLEAAPPVGDDAALVLRYRKAIFPLNLPKPDRMPTKLPKAIFPDAADDVLFRDYFLRQAWAIERLVDLIDRMGAIYDATPTAGTAAGWDVDDYRAAQAAMAEDSQQWMTVAKDVVGLFHADVTPRTLAFMRIVADLAGLDAAQPGGVVISLTRRPAEGDPETVSFG